MEREMEAFRSVFLVLLSQYIYQNLIIRPSRLASPPQHASYLFSTIPISLSLLMPQIGFIHGLCISGIEDNTFSSPSKI
jgi:hypothetical protein